MKASQLLRDCVGLPLAQGYYAYTAEGKRIGAHKPEAVCFCALGRVHNKGANITPAEDRIYAENMAIDALNRSCNASIGLVDWVDTPGRTVEEVDALFIKAAEYLEFNGR